MTKLADLKKKLMENPQFRDEYRKARAKMLLARSLAQARTEAGLTQEQLAQKVGIARSEIARLERGSISPSEEVLQSYAELARATPDIDVVFL